MIIFQVTVVIYLPPFVISICVETFPRIDRVHNVEYISCYDKALVLFLYDILVYHRWFDCSVRDSYARGRENRFRPLITADKESPSIKYSYDLARVKITRFLSW